MLWQCTNSNIQANKEALTRAGGVPKLLRLIESQNASVKERCVSTLKSLSTVPEARSIASQNHGMVRMVNMVAGLVHLAKVPTNTKDTIREMAMVWLWPSTTLLNLCNVSISMFSKSVVSGFPGEHGS